MPNSGLASDPPTSSEGKRWTLKVCPDCGNHRTAFALCEHQIGEEDEPHREDKFVEIEVAPASEVERLRKALRPFADAAENWSDSHLPDKEADVIYPRIDEISMGDLRRARAALHPDEEQG